MVRRLGLLALAAIVSTAVGAQERGGRPGGGTPGEFDFYVLALSWSPGYCAATGDRRGSTQCEAGRGLGFVTHGLWPQYERGYPSGCAGAREAPRYVIDETRDLYPDPGLARHEWRTHGACSGLSPTAYFAAVRTARAKVAIPEPLLGLDREAQTTPQSLERAFAAANPGLRADMMGVTCRRGALQEVRICLDRDLRGFRPCPQIDRNSCRIAPIRIEAPR